MILSVINAPPLPPAVYALLAFGLALGTACIVAAAVVWLPLPGERIYMDSHNAISSQASEDGCMHSSLRDGQQMLLFGREAAHANHSAVPGGEKAPLTNGTCGQSSCDSSPSAALQLSLENRLRARMEGIGSPEYVLTWRHWDMPSGPPICALRASGLRTSGKDCSGWPTPKANERAQSPKAHAKGFFSLLDQARTSGWATPDSSPRGGTTEIGLRPSGQKRQVSLQDQAKIAGWATPRASDIGRNRSDEAIARAKAKGGSTSLEDQSRPIGQALSTSPAETGSRGQLNPEFVCWLMGYPAAWLSCVDWATRSSRKSRRSS